ncbi:MAG: pyruvate kinase [Cyanobacteriota bacterium]|nr:pyruvate kinase [Cyanobacteriota bacterium]
MPLLDDLRRLRERLVALEDQEAGTLAAIAPSYQESARNLLHCIAFHQSNHPGLVTALRERGLSSLEGCEGHLAASLAAVIRVLAQLEGETADGEDPLRGPSHRRSLELRKRHSQALFGPSAQLGSRVIMVTLPAEAADHPAWIAELVEAGMGLARINCAHDTPAVWRRCIDNVRLASRATGRSCRIAMDLAGPKLRTGPLPPLAGVVEGRPRRDRFGRLLQPARLLARPARAEASDAVSPPPEPLTGSAPSLAETVLPVLPEGWQSLEPGQRLRGRDASGRWRELQVVEVGAWGVRLSSHQRCRFTAGLRFVQEGGEGYLVVDALPAVDGERLLRVGDGLRLTAAVSDAADAIPCSCPEVFASVREGEPVVFDDGRIQGRVEAVHPRELLVRITAARARGSRLRSDKGINFPESTLSLAALTAKDLEDLAFAAAHADILSYSFVRRVADIEALHRQWARQGQAGLALVLKIETRQAFLNLPRLLLAAMAHPAPLGVMIARGDLAIECGWEALAEIQEEILHLCAAAHVPCIWATQVLDSMVRHGTPTRAEITDAAMGARADALMLNKGPNLTATVQTLHTILAGMETRLPEHGRHRDQWRTCLAFAPPEDAVAGVRSGGADHR